MPGTILTLVIGVLGQDSRLGSISKHFHQKFELCHESLKVFHQIILSYLDNHVQDLQIFSFHEQL